MTVKFAVYDGVGKILYTGSVPDSMVALQKGNVYVGEADAVTQYVSDIGGAVELKSKPIQGATITTTPTGFKLDGVVDGSTIVVNDTPYETTGTTVEVDIPNVGVYKVVIVRWPYLDKLFEVAV